MFIPLHDTNTLKHIRMQYVTISLIVVNVLTWLYTGFAAPETVTQAATVGLGYIPAVAFDYAYLPPDMTLVPEAATYITYAFLHGDFWHLASNMVFLWVFGDNVEDALGHVRYLIFYLLCAAGGAFFHGILLPSSEAPLIGASWSRPMSSCIRACASGCWCCFASPCRCRPSCRCCSGSGSNSSCW